MKLVFFGSGEFALPILENLAKHNQIALAVTRPDSARDRGRQVKRSLVAQFCDDNSIRILQPETVNSPESIDLLTNTGSKLAVLASYSEILSQGVTQVFERGIVNVHPSMLPGYRGAEPVRWPIRRGDNTTGSTLMLISSGLDRGHILWQEEIAIDDADTYGTLTKKLIDLTNREIQPVLEQVQNGFEGVPQSQEKTFYARKLNKNDEKIDFQKPSSDLARQIKSMDPNPGMYCILDGKRIKFFSVTNADGSGKPGEVLSTDRRIVVACKTGAISVGEVQPENGKRMPAKSFLASGKLQSHDFFNSVDLDENQK